MGCSCVCFPVIYPQGSCLREDRYILRLLSALNLQINRLKRIFHIRKM